MKNSQNPEYKLWNGKNINGKSASADLIGEKRAAKTSAKYDVSNDTVSAKDLQKGNKPK